MKRTFGKRFRTGWQVAYGLVALCGLGLIGEPLAAEGLQVSGTVYEDGSWSRERLQLIGAGEVAFFDTLGVYEGRDLPGNHVGRIVSAPFVCDGTIRLFAGGNLQYPRTRLHVEDVESGESLRLISLRKINGVALKKWRLPNNWAGRTVRVEAVDENPGHSGWIGVSEPLTTTPAGFRYRSFGVALLMVANSLLPCVLLMILGWSGYGWISRWWPGAREHFLLLMFAVPSVLGLMVFFIALASVPAAILFSVFVVLGAVGTSWQGRASMDRVPWETIRWFAPVLWLMPLVAVLWAFWLHQYWTPHNSIMAAQERFFHHVLPLDNFLPYTTMERLFQDEGLKPFALEWRSSDRPPLQAGLLLLMRPFFLNAVEGYQGVSMFVNTWAFVGIAFFLKALGLGRRYTLWVLSLVVFSGTFWINGAYVWPRIYPLVFLFIVIGMLIEAHPVQRRDFGYWLMVGIGCALAILVHQGSVIALAGVFGVYLIRYPRLLRHQVSAAVLVILVLLGPWIAFQKHYDPPGNMLQKRFLANHPEFDDVSFGEALRNAYSSLTWKEWVDGRLANLKAIRGNFHGAFVDFPEQTGRGFYRLREQVFLAQGVAAVPALLGVLGIVLGWRRFRSVNHVRFVLALGMLLLGMLLWTVMLLPAGRTIIPHGSYLTPALIVCLPGYLAALGGRFLLWLSGLNLIFFYWVWLFPKYRSNLFGIGFEDVEIIDWGSMGVSFLVLLAVCAVIARTRDVLPSSRA